MPKIHDINSEECKLGQQIRKYRLLRGMTQNQLADLMDMDRASISRYENGSNGEMGFKTLKQLGDILDVSVDTLLGNDDEVDKLKEKISMLNEENRSIIEKIADSFLANQRYIV